MLLISQNHPTKEENQLFNYIHKIIIQNDNTTLVLEIFKFPKQATITVLGLQYKGTYRNIGV